MYLVLYVTVVTPQHENVICSPTSGGSSLCKCLSSVSATWIVLLVFSGIFDLKQFISVMISIIE